MTSLFYRRGLKTLNSVFPFHAHRKRLLTIQQLQDLGSAAIDTVGLVTKPRMQMEDFPCDGKPQRISRKEPLYSLRYQGHSYRVYKGIGVNRSILFTPREFASYEAFNKYVKSVIGDRDYHLTRVDFAFYLRKKIFSVDFLFASFWAKGYSLHDFWTYENPLHAKLSKSRLSMFVIGKRIRRFKFYDCDAHNINKARPESKMVNGMINFEVQLREYLAIVGISKIEHLKKPDFKLILDGTEFYKPSTVAFKNTSAEALQKIWKEDGLQKFMGALFKRWRTYDKIIPKLALLGISDGTLKQAIIEMAEIEHSKWITGQCGPQRFGIQSVRYLMTKRPPLFGPRDSDDE
jgi:hypothetical protein